MPIRAREDPRITAAMIVASAAALLLRFSYLVETGLTDPGFGHHAGLTSAYDQVARGILGGDPIGPFVVSPLYALFLAGVYALAGPDPAVVYGLQAVLGVGTVLVSIRLGARLGGVLGAWVAGLAVALHPAAIVYDAQLLAVSLGTFLGALAAARLQVAWDEGEGALGAGVALGLAALAWPNLLVAVPVLLVAFAWRGLRTEGPGRRWVLVWLVLGLGVALGPSTAHNGRAGAGLEPVAVGRGFELYRGNNPLFVDLPTQPFPVPDDPLGQMDKASLVASIDTGTRLGTPAADRYWTARAVENWRADPARYLGLYLRKCTQILGLHETADRVDVEAARRRSTVLRYLPPIFAPLAVVGLVGMAVRRQNPGAVPLVVIVAVGIGTQAVFFASGPDRVPLVPLFAAYAGAAASWACARWRDCQHGDVATAGLLAASLVALLAMPPTFPWLPWNLLADRPGGEAPCGAAPPATADAEAEGLFAAGLHALRRERLADAEAAFSRSAERAPGHPRAGVELARVRLLQGRPTEAMDAAVRLVGADPCNAAGWARLGEAALALDRAADAVRALEKAKAIDPYDVDVWLLLGEAHLADGQLEEARASLATADRWGSDPQRTTVARGKLELALGHAQVAAALLRDATARAPEDGALWAAYAEAEGTAGNAEAARAAIRRAEELGAAEDAIRRAREVVGG